MELTESAAGGVLTAGACQTAPAAPPSPHPQPLSSVPLLLLLLLLPLQVATARVKGAAKLEIPHIEDHVSKIDCVGLQVGVRGGARQVVCLLPPAAPGAAHQRPPSFRLPSPRRPGWLIDWLACRAVLPVCRPRRSWRTSTQQLWLPGCQTSTSPSTASSRVGDACPPPRPPACIAACSACRDAAR